MIPDRKWKFNVIFFFYVFFELIAVDPTPVYTKSWQNSKSQSKEVV